MQVTASMVKELRERTGAGMMDCKKALQEAGGDIDTAIEAMRKSGLAKAAKKAGRIAAEGVIKITAGENGEVLILEVNCETDFVAKDENFQAFTDAIAAIILNKKPADVDALAALPYDSSGQSVEEARGQLVAKIGENISVRRFTLVKPEGGELGTYTHGNRIGVVVDLTSGDAELAKDIAMHIAASRPICVTEAQVPQETLEKEREIFMAQAQESGKPAEIVEKMVTGRINKFIKEVALVGQPFVKDPDQTVGKLLQSKNASVNSFVRFEVGEGIEKREDNFVDEVMAQAKS